ncbi:Uncharacterised protein [Burkholderia pseudomallei]|nr:outer membrane efflux OprB domain protein [Burkholderia mallei]KGC64715.1 outer membrane efflux OprB domain protein [Burkholderia pseudomallei]KGW06376.1 putative outer membrane efflux protein OprB [Burkholderia pseudomallei MSHR4303]KGD47753.1 outer membrane efflux OprB domain protein [Burkholderia pseudomallei]KGD51945.1 outer membrane efflux OprB domain protein [Burkholderia pseudomallei]
MSGWPVIDTPAGVRWIVPVPVPLNVGKSPARVI